MHGWVWDEGWRPPGWEKSWVGGSELEMVVEEGKDEGGRLGWFGDGIAWFFWVGLDFGWYGVEVAGR